MLPGVVPVTKPLFRVSATKALAMLGLTAVLLLDAGDAASYDGSAQNWVDVSGAGNSFQRGSTSGAEATDAAFSGVAGRLSGDEYFSFDGGDFFTPAGAPTFDDAWHHDGAALTMVALFYPATINTVTTRAIFGNSDSSTLQGVSFGVTSSNASQFFVKHGTGSAVNLSSSALVVVQSVWNFLGWSISEAGGANASFCMVNSAVGLRNAAYTTPGAGAPNNAPQIGSRGGTSTAHIFQNADRLALFVASSSAWTLGQMRAFRDLMKGRFPSI